MGKADPTGEVMIRRLVSQINSTNTGDADLRVMHEPDKEWHDCIKDEVGDDSGVIIMDDDIIILDKDWYKKLMDSPYDVTGVKLMHADGSIQSYGGYINKKGGGDNGHDGMMDLGFDEPRETPYACFSVVYIKKRVLEQVNIINDDLLEGNYFEDVDFCFRARKAGYSVGVIPVPFIHLESVTKKSQEGMLKKFHRNFEVFKAININEFSDIKDKFHKKLGGVSEWTKTH